MKRYYTYIWGVFMMAVFLTIAYPTHAADFAQLVVRLDRAKTSTATTGVICAQPATLATEDSVSITFPLGFTVNPSTSAWTVSTSALPFSATQWPGVSTATDVTGRTITFPSGDLTVGTLYCFRFTNSSVLSTPSTAQTYSGTVTTYTSAASPIDSTVFRTSVVSNDQVTVTASVLPGAGDITVNLSSSPPSSTHLTEDNNVIYTLTYQSHFTSTTPLTLEASWSQGTISGTGNMIDIFNYVTGSATDTDGSVSPVVNTTNRTITWEIPVLNDNLMHTVQFQLKVRSSIPTVNSVSATVTADATVLGSPIDQDQLTYTIQTAVTPTPTAGPTATSAPGPSATPGPITTPTSVPAPVPSSSPPTPSSIGSVQVSDVSSDTARITFSTSQPSAYTIRYGTSPSSLTESSEDLTFNTSHAITLKGLKPKTIYYFRITIKDQNGKEVTSDIFTFTTASQKTSYVITPDNLTLSWDQLLLTSREQNTIMLPRNNPFTMHLYLPEADTILSITARITNARVLGLTSSKTAAPIEETRLIEILPGVFAGDLQPAPTTGMYELTFTIHDIYGGIYAVKGPYKIRVSAPITVLRNSSGQPLDDATVVIKRYEEHLKTYTPLTEGFAFENKTNSKGELNVALPQGKYLIEVSALGFKPVSKELQIGPATETYPSLSMESDASLMNSIRYISQAVTEVSTYCVTSVATIFSSQKARALLLILAELGLLIITLAGLSLRLQIGLFGLPLYFMSEVWGMLKPKSTFLTIHIADLGDDSPLSGVAVYVMDHEYRLLHKGKTAMTGSYSIPENVIHIPHVPYKLFLYRKGYYTYPIVLDQMSIQSGQIYAHMHKEVYETGSTQEFRKWIAQMSLAFFSDSMVVLAILSAFLMARYEGVTKSLPMISVTFVIFIFWLIYIKNLWKIEMKRT